VQSTNVFFIERRRLVELAAENRLPVIYPTREFVDAGGLMSYVANTADLLDAPRSTWTRSSRARSLDLPIEQPSKFELAINLKTAKALGEPPTDRITEPAVHELAER
jgi:putative ABC transport system substrate-binding protein